MSAAPQAVPPQISGEEKALRLYCERFKDSIYVRHVRGLCLGVYALSELTEAEREKHIRYWLAEGEVPARLNGKRGDEND